MQSPKDTIDYYENGWNQCLAIFSSPQKESPQNLLALKHISLHGNQKELFLFAAEYLDQVEIQDQFFVLRFIGNVYLNIKKQHLYKNEFLNIIDIVMNSFVLQLEDSNAICSKALENDIVEQVPSKEYYLDSILSQLGLLSEIVATDPTILILDRFVHILILTDSSTLYQKALNFLINSSLSFVQLLEIDSVSISNIIALYGYFDCVPSTIDNLYLFNKLIVHLFKNIQHESLIKFHLNLLKTLFQRVNLNNHLSIENTKFELLIDRMIFLISSSNSMHQSIEIYNLLKKIIFKFDIKSRVYIIMKCMTSGVYCLEQISIELLKDQLDNEQSEYFWNLIESVKGIIFDPDSQFYKNEQFGLQNVKENKSLLVFKLDLLLSSLNCLYYILRKKDVEWKNLVYFKFVDVIEKHVKDLMELSKNDEFKITVDEANIEVIQIDIVRSTCRFEIESGR